MTESKPYGRDLVGYGEFPPRVLWPEGCKLALSFVLNFEEGAENSIELGDAHAENFITEVPSGSPLYGARNVNTESMYDYGSRVGVWRILDLFDEFGFPLTIFAVGTDCCGDGEFACGGLTYGAESETYLSGLQLVD